MYVVAGLALSAMMFLTVADVILRIFKRPIVGTYEIVGLLGAVVVGFAIPQTSRLKGHVIMDFLTGTLSPGWQRILGILTRLLAIALFAIIAWQIIGLGNDFRRGDEGTLTLHWPTFPIAYGIGVCCIIECLVLLLQLFEIEEQEDKR
jgi:TRAP-type C4-dicarboxylate transport system permease small subunit